MLPRLQLFEFNDHPRAPKILKESVIDALSRSLKWGGLMDGLVPVFQRFIDESGADEVLDLAAGAGGPAEILVGAMKEAGVSPPRMILTDLQPRPEAWRELSARHAGAIEFVSEIVDATAIPPDLARDRARVIINALHHFPPAIARGLLVDAVQARAPFLVVESFPRNPLGFAAFGPVGLRALMAGPILAKDRRVLRAVLTWFTPVAISVAVWDGLVSTMRIYEERDLRAMIGEREDYDFEWGTYPTAMGSHGVYFSGIPR